MRLPETPERFAEPWHAQVLGLAQLLIEGGHVSATDWAEALGAALDAAARRGAPDTEETYYTAALAALEQVSEMARIEPGDLNNRVEAWRQAYLDTPHGQPVHLKDG